MQRGAIQTVIAIVSVIGVWFVFNPEFPSSEALRSNDSTASIEAEVEHLPLVVSDDEDNLNPEQIDPVREALNPSIQEGPDAAVQSASIDADLSVWSVDPAVMENLILQEFSQLLGLGLVFINSVECTASTCVMHYDANDRFDTWDRLKQFREKLMSPPYNAAEVTNSSSAYDETDSSTSHSIEINRNISYATAGEYLNTRMQSLRGRLESLLEGLPTLQTEDLRRYYGNRADEALVSTSYDAPPATFRGYFGERVIAENVCSYNCPYDYQRMIHFDVYSGLRCTQMDGVQRVFDTQNSSGIVTQRIFCIPSSLAND